MDPQPPLVLERIDLPAFMQYILKKHAPPSTLIICSTKDVFLQQSHVALVADSTQDDETKSSIPRHAWITPTLRLLASSRNVKVVFCPDLPHLRAYLASYAHRASLDRDTQIPQATARRSTRILAVLNPIQLHRPTSAFSAQGLNRTFATAVDAAYRTGSRLVLTECPTNLETISDEDIAMGLESDGVAVAVPSTSTPWDDEVSILNVTTKSFGAGERGWVGRTVKVRTIAERWCVFEDMSTAGH
jgi:hypothetical protein